MHDLTGNSMNLNGGSCPVAVSHCVPPEGRIRLSFGRALAFGETRQVVHKRVVFFGMRRVRVTVTNRAEEFDLNSLPGNLSAALASLV